MNALKKVFFLLFLMLFIVGCKNRNPITTAFSGIAMTIEYHITIGRPLNEQEKALAQNLIDKTFQEIDSHYNKWNPSSEISQINALEAGVPYSLSPQLASFLQQVDEFVAVSEGRFDPTIEPLQKLWKKKVELGQAPHESEINALRPFIGWDKIILEGTTLTKKDSRTELDLGGIAKGLCVDLLTERLKDLGYSNVFVEWGGDIRATGQHPSGRPWNIYISRLSDSNPQYALAYVTLKNQAIATSGDYFQFWKVKNDRGDVKTYCHIFNPHTLMPVEVKKGSIATASLVAPDCLTADALAKVAMLFESGEEALEWAKKIKEKKPELDFWIATHDKETR